MRRCGLPACPIVCTCACASLCYSFPPQSKYVDQVSIVGKKNCSGSYSEDKQQQKKKKMVEEEKKKKKTQLSVMISCNKKAHSGELHSLTPHT